VSSEIEPSKTKASGIKASVSPTENTPPEATWQQGGHFPWSAVFLSLLFAPLCCYWAQAQGVDRIFSLMVPPVILTLLLVAVNIPLRLYAPRLALSQGDLIVFYGMQAVMCAMASEWVDVIHPYIYSYGIFHHPETEFYVLPYVSDWLFFKTDRGPLEGFNFGGKSLSYFWAHLGPWWPKILAWTGIVSLVSFAMLCINALMEEQWTERERLSFPLVQLPLAITQGGGASSFWRSRLMWGFFAVMFGIDMLNGFAFLYPALPSVNVRFLGDISRWTTSPPWNQIGWTPIGLFPFMAAIGVFMPLDLLFSLLFFFFVRKGEQVVAAAFGYPQGTFGGGGLSPSAPYFSEQSWGAFLGLFAGALWAARPYLKEVWGQVVQGAPRDSGRVPPRLAFGGLCVSVAALGFVGLSLGLPFFYVALYVLLFLMFSTAMTRLRAQLGAPTHEMAFMGPNQLFADFHGTSGVDAGTIARTVTTFHFMNRIHRTHPMPSQLDAFYLGRRARVSPRGMFAALLVATVVGSVLGHLIRTYLDYHETPADSSGDTTNLIRTLTVEHHGPNVAAMLAVAAGFGAVLLLDALRFQIPSLPLHPAGFALAMNFGVDYYWFGLLIALIAKFSTLRYSGLRGFEQLRLAALGIMLGEFCAEAIWATYSMLHHDQPTYTISINGKMGWQN
jgi:hypothetical protein